MVVQALPVLDRETVISAAEADELTELFAARPEDFRIERVWDRVCFSVTVFPVGGTVAVVALLIPHFE